LRRILTKGAQTIFSQLKRGSAICLGSPKRENKGPFETKERAVENEDNEQFHEENIAVFTRAQLVNLGRVHTLQSFSGQDYVLKALRQSSIMQQSLSGGLNG
jgi:hypothetical protein